MAANVYSNGLPHPSRGLRLRFAAELLVLVVLATLFFCLTPESWHNNGTYFGLSLIMLGFIGFTAREAKARIWGPPDSPDFDRVRRCALYMFVLTIPPVLLFLIFGAAARRFEVYDVLAKQYPLSGIKLPAANMFGWHFFAALCLYLPWALVQQTLFQFYLLGRLRALLPFAPPLFLSIITGILYGLVHLRGDLASLGVAAVTIIGGIFWSYSYYRDRYVLPIAISHAVLGATFYYWVYGRDLLGEFIK